MATGNDDSARTDEGAGDAGFTPDLLSGGHEPPKDDKPKDDELGESKADLDEEETSDKTTRPAAEESAEQPKKGDPKLPWDPERQTAAQGLANLRKTLEASRADTAKMQAELEALRRGEKPPERLEDVVASLEALDVPEPPDDEFDEDGIKKYRTELAKYKANKGRLTDKVRELAKPPARPKAEEPPPKPPEDAKPPKGATQKDLVKVLDEGDKKYGAKYRAAAAASAVKELESRGYDYRTDKVPTIEALRDLVFRHYLEIMAGNKGKPEEKPVAEAVPDKGGSTGFTRQDLPAEPGRLKFPTVTQLANEMKARLRPK